MGEELERVLRVAFLTIWKGLSVKTQHRLEGLGIALISLGLINAVGQDLRSEESGLKAIWRGLKSLIAHGSIPIKAFLRLLCAPTNLEMIPATIFLIVAAFGEWPYNFYILTRIIACPTLIWIALLIHPRRYLLWEVSAAMFALVLNPVVPFHFAKGTWEVFNLMAAIAIIPAIYLRLKETSQAPTAQAEIAKVAVSHVNTSEDSIDRKYRYCAECSVRVGRSDSICKRCGNGLR